MFNTAKEIFKVEETVSLKLKPEFRGLIEYFSFSKDATWDQAIAEELVPSLPVNLIWVTVSYIDDNMEGKMTSVPYSHLAKVEF
jgi:hypothetical protein